MRDRIADALGALAVMVAPVLFLYLAYGAGLMGE